MPQTQFCLHALHKSRTVLNFFKRSIVIFDDIFFTTVAANICSVSKICRIMQLILNWIWTDHGQFRVNSVVESLVSGPCSWNDLTTRILHFSLHTLQCRWLVTCWTVFAVYNSWLSAFDAQNYVFCTLCCVYAIASLFTTLCDTRSILTTFAGNLAYVFRRGTDDGFNCPFSCGLAVSTHFGEFLVVKIYFTSARFIKIRVGRVTRNTTLTWAQRRHTNTILCKKLTISC